MGLGYGKDEVYLSPRWKSVLGYEEDEFISREDARDLFIHPEDLKKTKDNLKKHLKGETEVYLNEYRLRHKDGTYRWILERGLALKDERTGKPYRMAGTITDITERKKSVEELRKVNQALLEERRMFIKGNVVVFRVNVNDFYDIKYMSENVGDVLGYSVDDFMSARVDFSSIVYSEDRDLHKMERDRALQDNATHFEFSVYRIVKKNGEIVYVKDFITIIRNEKDEPVEFLGYFIDVTKEKQAENTIRENQKKYFTLFSEANDAILMIEDGKIVDCNSKAEELFNYDRAELINTEILKLSPEKQPSGTPSAEKRQRKIKEAYEGNSSTFYWQYRKSTGDMFDAEVSLSVVELNEIKYLHAIIRDITERKSIEKELRLSRQMYESLMDAMPDMIFIMTREGKYVHFKPDKLTGLEVAEEKIVGKKLDDFFEGEKKNEFQQKIEIVLDNSVIETIRYNLDSPKGIRNFEGRITKLNENEVFVQVRDFTNPEL